MTGIYVRIKRDAGDWGNVEIDQMTDSELENFVNSLRNTEYDGQRLLERWIMILAKWVRDNVKEKE